MTRARIAVGSEVDWTAASGGSAVLLVRAAHARDQRIVEEHLDFPLLPWTLPIRYSPSDHLAGTAHAELGVASRARALLQTAAAWVRTQIACIPGAGDSFTIAFLRALEIPVRVVACDAPPLDPPDFHALMEAHDGEAWRLMDATGLAPVETVVRVAAGRDAAEVTRSTGDPSLALDDVRVSARIGDG